MLESHHLFYVVLELVIACLAVAGNTLVCWAVIVNSNLQNVTNFFVVSLAVADIAVGVLAIPFSITISFGFCANFHGCLSIACFVIMLTQVSIFTLLAIALDRYIAIRKPLRYHSVVTGQRAKAFITLCWVLSFVVGLTPMMGWNAGETTASSNITDGQMSGCPEGLTLCLFEEVIDMNFMVYFNFFGCILLPLVVMASVYCHIFVAARRQLRLITPKIPQPPGPGGRSMSLISNRLTLQQEVRVAKSLAVIVGLFAICWLPLHIINSVNHICEDCERPGIWVMNIAIILSHANSVVNPFIYAYRIREFRNTFRKILYLHILRKSDGRRSSNWGSGASGGWNNSASVRRRSSPPSIKSFSGEMVVNDFMLHPTPVLTPPQGSSEFSWTSTVNVSPKSCKSNGLQIKSDTRSATEQQLCIVGVSARFPEESAAGKVEIKDSGRRVTFVNVPAFSSHQTYRNTQLPQVS